MKYTDTRQSPFTFGAGREVDRYHVFITHQSDTGQVRHQYQLTRDDLIALRTAIDTALGDDRAPLTDYVDEYRAALAYARSRCFP